MGRSRGRRSRDAQHMRDGMAQLIVFAVLIVLGIVTGTMLPLTFLLPGLALLWLVRRLGRSAAILTIPGTMGVAMGLLLWLEALTGLVSWAVAWPLIVPGALGLGLSVYGTLARKPRADAWGDDLALGGVWMTIALALLLKVVVPLLGALGWLITIGALPLLMVAGVVWLLRRGRRRRHLLYTRRTPVLGDGSERLDFSMDARTRERV